jgi:hypothetical protein
MPTQYFCKNDLRRAVVRDALDGGGDPIRNGIDYLEIASADQKTLVVHFIHPLPGEAGGFPASPLLTRHNFVIEGGVRVKDIRILDPLAASGHELTLLVDRAGDFSTYRLRLVASPHSEISPAGFDPQLAEVQFTFKIDCPSDFDCQPEQDCPPEALPQPPLDYLAKDYASFRRLMLDRLAVVMPDWQERNAADVGIAIVETLAYAADQLSYYQDAVATEAYLGTARKRVSVRRHARLLDYPMHDGVNARAWVQIRVNENNVEVPAELQLFTRIEGLDQRLEFGSAVYQQAMSQNPEVFETLYASRLHAAQNDIPFYTWGDADCCLPKGATRASLRGNLPFLAPGDVLVFEEVRGARSGLEADADPGHRQAVRLTKVSFTQDPLGGQFLDPPTSDPIDVTEVEWRVEDALAFPLCLSSRSGLQYFADISMARGNIVLADHGFTYKNRPLDPEAVPLQGRYRPRLERSNVTQVVPYHHKDMTQRPARQAVLQDPRQTLPAIKLTAGPETWLPQHDLLDSDRFAPEFVAEIEAASPGTGFPSGSQVALRFGDNLHGRKPAGGIQLKARYRVGNGPQGNIGADVLAHVVTTDTRITGVRNPLPAQGGTGPEQAEEVRLYAPQAFRIQERAVTAEDYSAMAQRHPEVQKAVATLRWTGSWQTVFITVDRQGGRPVSSDFEAELRLFLEKYRMAGHDLEIDGPHYIPLDLALTVCLQPGYTRSAVKQALLEAFSDAVFLDGRRGFFHPDNLTFGQTVYLSQLVAEAMKVPGVEWVKALRFQRWGQPTQGELAEGRIPFGRLEIPQLENDPNAPENGKLEFVMEGGL